MQSIALDLTNDELPKEFARILKARGLSIEERSIGNHEQSASLVIAKVITAMPSASEFCALGKDVAEHAKAGKPPVLFLPPAQRKRGKADEFAASTALLRAYGAVVTSDPEVWVECLVLLSGYGAPSGPRVAIVAPPGCWLAAAAAAQARRAEHLGERFTPFASTQGQAAATDIVLADSSLTASSKGETRSFVLPVAGFAHLQHGRPVLVGLNNALVAAELCGQATQRIAAGPGPATEAGLMEGHDPVRFQNQLDKLTERVGDHECKVLLSSYGVRITRQAVATTPSAAGRIAKKAGYPVEIKAWGADQPSEREGAMVVRGIDTAAEVRRAFASVCARTQCDAVIVRETPMPGRELRVSIRDNGALGLVAFIYQDGHRDAAAGLAPLRRLDAESLARQVVATRSEDSDPDFRALADLLVAATHLVADNKRMRGLELSRVVVGKEREGVLVVDASATLTPR